MPIANRCGTVRIVSYLAADLPLADRGSWPAGMTGKLSSGNPAGPRTGRRRRCRQAAQGTHHGPFGIQGF
jgi:hypothetical protein